MADPSLIYVDGDRCVTEHLHTGSRFERGILENKSGNYNLPSLIVRQAAARAGPHSTRGTVWHEITGGEKRNHGTTVTAEQMSTGCRLKNGAEDIKQ